MQEKLPETEKWLSLSEAAKELSIHPTTLRRWADNKEIPYMLTPGGHRRFALRDVQQFAHERRQLRRVPELEQLWAQQALTQTRQEIVAQEGQQWLTVYDAHTRQQHRQLGRKLMGLTLRYISSTDESIHLLEEAREVGHAYGRMAQGTGLPLTEALQAAMFFRDTLVEVAIQMPETARVQPETNVRLMRRINRLLNTVHLAIADVYDV